MPVSNGRCEYAISRKHPHGAKPFKKQQCKNRAIYTTDGKAYCAAHDPRLMAAREHARAQKREAARLTIGTWVRLRFLYAVLYEARQFLQIPETDVVIARARTLTLSLPPGDAAKEIKEYLAELRKLLRDV